MIYLSTPANIESFCVNLLVFHLEISGNDVNALQL